jgi:hypothetical protein
MCASSAIRRDDAGAEPGVLIEGVHARRQTLTPRYWVDPVPSATGRV